MPAATSVKKLPGSRRWNNSMQLACHVLSAGRRKGNGAILAARMLLHIANRVGMLQSSQYSIVHMPQLSG